MRENYTLTRLYVEQSLNDGADIELPKEQAHYLGTVLRLKVGGELRIFNGTHGEWRAEIEALSKRQAQVKLVAQLRKPYIPPDIELVFAPVKKHRTAFIVEKATELGVRALRPMITERTQFPKLNIEKMCLQAIEAAEQTERLDVPTIHAPVKLNPLIANWPADRTLIFADEAGEAPPAFEVLQHLEGPTALLIGPEGGFSPQEREMLRAQSFVRPVSLGPRILRADTAALSLLTLWQVVQGDWHEG